MMTMPSLLLSVSNRRVGDDWVLMMCRRVVEMTFMMHEMMALHGTGKRGGMESGRSHRRVAI